MVATDGHKMAVIHDPEGHADRAAILSLDFKSVALKTGKKDVRDRRVRLMLDKGCLPTVAPVGLPDGSNPLYILGSVPITEIDGTFPIWWRVAECGAAFGMTPQAPVSINPAYLALCATAFRLLAETKDQGMVPILVTGKANAITLGAAEQLSNVGMNPADEFRVYANPAYRQLKPAILARLTGRSVQYVKQRLAVLRLPEAIVTATLTGLISVDHACGLTYFEDDEAGLSAMFERCMNDRRIDGDDLRARWMREISEWSEHPLTAYVSREDFFGADEQASRSKAVGVQVKIMAHSAASV